MLKFIRDTHLSAFWQGFVEHVFDGCGGRTHPTDQDWNEAYDRGMNLAERVRPSLAD
jgi:hypothetical protein